LTTVDLVSVSIVASGGGSAKTYAVVAVVGVIILATTGVWNPFPKPWNWVNTSAPIAEGSFGGTVWQRSVNDGASAALTPFAAIVASVKPSRIIAVSPSSGAVLAEARTEAKVLPSDRRA
jgi:outer membrane protein assembly factor BamB